MRGDDIDLFRLGLGRRNRGKAEFLVELALGVAGQTRFFFLRTRTFWSYLLIGSDGFYGGIVRGKGPRGQ